MERIKPKLRLVWPPNYLEAFEQRQQTLFKLRRNPGLVGSALAFYKDNPVEFIEHWCVTYDPRNAGTDKLTTMPFILFKRQKEMVDFVYACLKEGGSGLIEKSKDMGVTWLCCAISIHLFLFWPGASIGWGSRKAMLVDAKDNPDSIFEKMRIILRTIPPEFLPKGFSLQENMPQMKIYSPETGNTITGEAGDEIGRGGRSLVYFKDESAHYEHPEAIEKALSDNAKVQIDFSSVSGLGTVFHRRREAGVDWAPGQPIRRDRTNVLVMDWRDHPDKSEAWYAARKAKFDSEGLSHVLAQEVDRNYAASVVGTIIKPVWLQSCVDAHIHLKSDNFGTGGWGAGLDVADEGGDTNALALREGNILRSVEEWGARDIGVTTRKVVAACRGLGFIEVQYDAPGVGSSVKSEYNRLMDDGLIPKDITLTAWQPGGEVLHPDRHIIAGDRSSMLNRDFYRNLKAQGWWELGRRCELTHRARTEPDFTWDAADLISIDSRIPLLHKLLKELAQPCSTTSSNLKLMVDKKPDGSKSPNLADSVMMCYWPMPSKRPMKISADVMRWASQRG